MKIVALYRPTHEIIGLGLAFNNLGHDFLNWWPDKKCPFDMANELKPSLIILPSSSYFTEEIETVAHINDIRLINAEGYSGVDTLRFKGKYTEKYKCDVGFYFDGDVDKTALKTAEALFEEGLRVKVWGAIPVHSPLYLGHCFPADVGNLIATCPLLIAKRVHYNSFIYNNIGSSSYEIGEIRRLRGLSKEERKALKIDTMTYIDKNSYLEKAKKILNEQKDSSL